MSPACRSASPLDDRWVKEHADFRCRRGRYFSFPQQNCMHYFAASSASPAMNMLTQRARAGRHRQRRAPPPPCAQWRPYAHAKLSVGAEWLSGELSPTLAWRRFHAATTRANASLLAHTLMMAEGRRLALPHGQRRGSHATPPQSTSAYRSLAEVSTMHVTASTHTHTTSRASIELIIDIDYCYAMLI